MEGRRRRKSFDIDTSYGQLLTKAALDYETKPSYTVTVSVRDSKDADGNPDTADDDTIMVTIETSTNVDEDGEVTFSATQPQVDTALTATLADPDGDRYGSITWTWEKSPDGSSNWTIISGATSASYTPVDRRRGRQYLRVTASYTDGEGPGKSADAVSTNPVQAAPETNVAPEFSSTETGTRSVAENTPAGEDIGDPVVATDADNDTLTYSLDEDNTDSLPHCPRVRPTADQRGARPRGQPSYTVTVTATDPSGESDSIEVTITVTDVDEPPARPRHSNG